MRSIIEYIKECLDVDNFSYKFDVWFQKDKENLDKVLNFMKDCYNRRIVTKEDVEAFLANTPKFKLKKVVDVFDEDVKRDDAINVDYIYLFTKIIERFITNTALNNKIDYKLQAQINGNPQVEIDNIPMQDKEKEEN